MKSIFNSHSFSSGIIPRLIPVVGLLALGLAGCGTDHYGHKTTHLKSKIQFSPKIAGLHKKYLTDDLKLLQTLKIDPSKAENLRPLIENWDDAAPAESLVHWLEARVKYIITDVAVERDPNLIEMSPANDRELNIGGEARYKIRGTRLIENFGAAVFREGRERGLTYNFIIPDIGKAVMNSPRIGIIQIGPELFAQIKPFKNGAAGDTLHSLHRLAILFRAAKQSDVKGFPFVECPSWHERAGLKECDDTSDGPNSVAGQFLKTVVDSCRLCSADETEPLRQKAQEALNRVLPGYGPGGSHGIEEN